MPGPIASHVRRPRPPGLVTLLVGAITIAGTSGSAMAMPATVRAATVLGDCTEASFRAAVAGGGVVSFGVDCFATPVVLTTPVEIPSGLSVEIRTEGHRVALSGGSVSRHFTVTGGTLRLVGSPETTRLVLRNGRVQGASGLDGATGASGQPGIGGNSNPEPTIANPFGLPLAGTPGNSGGNGATGGGGEDARGGSILVMAGVVELTDVSFTANSVLGGSGGAGGNGGQGGAGGSGG